MDRPIRSARGFTLVEALIVIAVLGLLAMIGPTLITNLIRFYQLHSAKVEIQRDARAALDIVNRFLRQAQSSTIVVDEATGQPPYSRVSFKTIEGQNIQFYQQGNTLYQVDQSTTTICQDLHYIAFTYPRTDDPTILSVALTMEASTYQGGYKALELSIEEVRIMD